LKGKRCRRRPLAIGERGSSGELLSQSLTKGGGGSERGRKKRIGESLAFLIVMKRRNRGTPFAIPSRRIEKGRGGPGPDKELVILTLMFSS